ncbi:MAG TPA: SIMPL domain-containing protein [Longimicrobiales bacterium]|nr:SIMPL domain-containing protein [Longimicrobiales bacterium]
MNARRGIAPRPSPGLAGAGAAALAALAAAGPLNAQQEQTAAPDHARTVAVTATGSVDAVPDQAILTIAVETVGGTAEEALGENAARADAVIRTLMDAGIERADIGTASFGLNPEYARPERGAEQQEPRIVGYRAYNMLRVVVDDLAAAGEIIDAAARAGGNRIGGPTFGIADPQPLRLRALEAAVEKARAEAEVLAAALGMALGEPLSVDTSFDGGGPGPVPMARYAMEADVATPIEAGTQSVSATVRITWSLASR